MTIKQYGCHCADDRKTQQQREEMLEPREARALVNQIAGHRSDVDVGGITDDRHQSHCRAGDGKRYLAFLQ